MLCWKPTFHFLAESVRAGATDYRDPRQYLRLAVAHAATGSPDQALKTLRLGRDLVLATGEHWLAEGFERRMNEIAARNAHAGESK